MARVRNFGGKAQGALRFGGVNLTDTEYLTIGDKVYEWDNNAAVTAGRVLVTIGGSVAASITNLINAINANKPSVPVTASADPVDALVVRIFADQNGSAGNLAMSENMTDALNIVGAAAMTGGENAGTQTLHRGEYTVLALDVTATNILIETGLVSPRYPQVLRFDASGEFREAVTGNITVTGSKLKHDFAGATDLIAGDKLVWTAWE